MILKGLSPHTCFALPLTSSNNKHSLRINIGEVSDVNATGIISQMRVIDTKRLTERIQFLNKDKFSEIRKAVRDLF